MIGTARYALSTSNRTFGDLHFYDDESATWSGHVAASGAKPAPRFGAAMAAYGDLLVLFRAGLAGRAAPQRPPPLQHDVARVARRAASIVRFVTRAARPRALRRVL